MSFSFALVERIDKTALPLNLPELVSSDMRVGPTRCLREDDWENEGRLLVGEKPLVASPAILAGDVEVLVAQVNGLERRLSSEYADGRVGTRYNTYAHRSRVLSRQKTKLDALRSSFLAQEQRL